MTPHAIPTPAPRMRWLCGCDAPRLGGIVKRLDGRRITLVKCAGCVEKGKGA